jgi:hypothetical protein
MAHTFEEGDRVRYIGPPEPGSGEPSLGIPDLMPGEEGWLIDAYPPDHVWVVSWDSHGTIDMGGADDLEWLGYNEPDAMKRVPKDSNR